MTVHPSAESFPKALQELLVRHEAELVGPLSVEQRRLWLLGSMASGSWAVVVGRYQLYRTFDAADIAQLRLEMASLAARHEALRTVFFEVLGRPVRLVLPAAELPLQVVHFGFDDNVDDTAILRQLAVDRFSLSHGPLLRSVLLCPQDGDKAELVLVGHRLILDETSLDRLAAELFGFKEDNDLSLEDFFEAQRSRLSQQELVSEARNRAAELVRPAATEIPPFGQRPVVKNTASAYIVVPLILDMHTDVDWEVVVATAWLIVVMRSQASRSAVCGVRAGRSWTGPIGPLDTIRPVRVDEALDLPMPELVKRVELQLRTPAMDAPFAYLLEVSPPRRDVSRTPYFQTAVRTVDHRSNASMRSVARPRPNGIAATEYDIDVTVFVNETDLTVSLSYDEGLYSIERIRSIVDQFSCALRAVCNDTGTAETVPLLDDEGVRQAITVSGGYRTATNFNSSLVDLIARQASISPTSRAVVQGDAELTYGNLWTQTLLLAGKLKGDGIEPGDRVCLFVRRSPAAIVSLLGVLAAGATFVPIDAAYPLDRVRFLLSDARPALVISESAMPRLDELEVPTLLLDDLDLSDTASMSSTMSLPLNVDADAPAYVIYTSGTTGRPKGVVVRHRNVVNNITWRQSTWPLGEADAVLHNHAFSFDPAVWAVLWPLTTGASIVLADEAQIRDPNALISIMDTHNVSVLGGVPSMISTLLEHREAGLCTRIRLVLSGAESLNPDLVEKIESTWSAEVVNLYGPTEATIDATGYRVPYGAPTVPIPIGRPVHNVGVYLVDANLNPVPIGVPGEILISGAGVAIGYHRRTALTASRFLPNPFDDLSSTLYRTGDLGRRLPNGDVQFLGRIDSQVKIRGYRIELGEVEAALRSLSAVQDVCVVALCAGTDRAHLGAAIVVRDNSDLTVIRENINASLASTLPEHLVPSKILTLDKLPRTANGKVDTRAVTKIMDETTRIAPGTASEVTGPRTALERSVASAFMSSLGVADVDVSSDFFELGGTSVLLARLAAQLRDRHDVDIPLHEFFRVPTIEGVAETIEVYRREGIAGVMGRKHAADLENDANLDPAIDPSGLPKACWSEPKRVFLTGATGYLGLHLIEQLLRRTKAEVVCLCRARDEQHAWERIEEGLRLYEIGMTEEFHRVCPIVGDLSEPRLGLTVKQWDELACTVDVIYHNGAMVNFVYPYSALKAANVSGTQEVLRLACAGRLKAVSYVSTIDTLLATHTPRPFLENDAPLNSAVNVPAGYTGSKWVAEKMVDQARRRGVPVSIFRPGLILGHTETGAAQTIDYLLVALRGFLPMRILPDYPRIFDIVPVNYVASAIVHISTQPGAAGKFFHLFNPNPVALRKFCDWVHDYGYEFDIVAFEEGRRRALSVGPGHPLYSLVPLIKDAEASPHRALDPKHIDEVNPAMECANTIEMLKGSDVSCPQTSRRDAYAILDYLVRTEFMAAPASIQYESVTPEVIQ